MKKMFITAAAALLVSASVSALDLTFTLSPGMTFTPAAFSENTTDIYNYGFTGFAQADVDLFGFMTAGLEGQGLVMKAAASEGFSSGLIYGGGANLGFYYYPLSRLYVGAGAAGGIYEITQTVTRADSSGSSETWVYEWSDFYWRGYGELGFRINPNVTVGATGGYCSFLRQGTEPVLSGFFGGLNVRLTASIGKKGSGDIGVTVEQYGPVMPSYMNVYRNYPFAAATLRNNSGAELRNVHVYLRAGKYTSAACECAFISRMRKYGTEEIALTADFSDELLRFSEDGKIQAEIIVDYEFLGKKMESVQEVTLSVDNRNAFTWSDGAGLSAFVSPDTPEILELSKYIAGVARNNFISGMNRSIQTAAAMAEGLRLCGISYSNDSETPYLQYHNSAYTDSVQFPLQTVNYLSGDYDDIGILLMSCLESVGIGTAYMTVDDDFVVLVDTGIKPGQELNHFGTADGLLVDDSHVYFGLSMTAFEKGFAESRKKGSEEILKAINGEYEAAEVYDVSDAWTVYAPCVYTGSGTGVTNPEQTLLASRINAAVKNYIDTDLAEVVARARASGDSNKLGVALFRSGRLAEAKKEFSKLNTVAAKNNLANIYMIEKNYAEAARLYSAVLAQDPENRIARKGLDSANGKLGK